MLLEHFTNGTEGTITGRQVGCEVETDFVDAITRAPISAAVSRKILAARAGRPEGCEQKLELGRQKIELAIAPSPSAYELIERTHASLAWLYGVAGEHGAVPLFEPEISWAGDLLDVSSDPRDQVWIQLDGHPALEELCRCSSVQFTVDVHPGDAVDVLNALWGARLHERDYAPNDRRWRAYIGRSAAGYRPDRYAGPRGFDSLEDYVQQLVRHDVVMHQGRPVRLSPLEVPDLDLDLFLRSVWWHYRLRRFGGTLAVEVRPLARRHDDDIRVAWKAVATAIGL
ncbi:MAG TPA: hypothetical protein VHQ86_06395 [Candidatus Saccharimonadia bacterium]|jgi:hypothetical protein|nr:hypothetical protein [Candidatus Saccharimonadia bacterium]